VSLLLLLVVITTKPLSLPAALAKGKNYPLHFQHLIVNCNPFALQWDGVIY